MFNKKFILLAIFLLSLIAISTVSAVETTEDTSSIGIDTDEYQLVEQYDDEIESVEDDLTVLDTDEDTSSQLCDDNVDKLGETIESDIVGDGEKKDLNLTINCEPVVYNGTAMITIEGFGDAQGAVHGYIPGGISSASQILGGRVMFFFRGMTENTTVYIEYQDPNGIYNDFRTELLVIVFNQTNTVIESSPVTTVYNGGKYLVATLKDDKGNPMAGIKVNIKLSNGKTFSPTTDGNGQVKVSADGLAPNTYTATITFDGNKYYINSTKEVKITVKKATPKMTAKSKTFKAKTKIKKYSIVLKDNKNKAMKKVRVTLKVKGKTYKATTNTKGKATFKITKLTKKGKYKAVITYKGNKYYNKVVKKPRIRVKA